MFPIVLDTNVLVAATRSRRGASFKLLSLVGTGSFDVVLSVPLVLEYEYALRKSASATGLSQTDISQLLDYLCRVSRRQEIYFLWRPILRDPFDDMVLEVAVASSASHIVTFNKADFAGADRFGLTVSSPAEFIKSEGLQ